MGLITKLKTEGNVDSVDASLASGPFGIGGSVFGNVTFDDAATDIAPSNRLGVYNTDSWDFGGYNGASGFFVINDGGPLGTGPDSLFYSTTDITGPAINGLPPALFEFELIDPFGLAFNDDDLDQLSAGTLDFGGFSQHTFSLTFDDGTASGVDVSGPLTDAVSMADGSNGGPGGGQTTVPEPGTVFILGSGLLLLALFNEKARRIIGSAFKLAAKQPAYILGNRPPVEPDALDHSG